MSSTFYGIGIALSALQASQANIDVSGQNTANVSTEGYTRQSVDQSALTNSGISYKYAQSKTSAIGAGVSSDSIIQIRDQFLDLRYRKANSEYNTDNTSLSILSEIEDVFDESQTDGLNAMLTDFYKKLEYLSSNAGDIEFSTVFRSAAQKVTQTLNEYANQLSDIKDQELYDLNIVVDEVNTLLSKVNNLNTTIKSETLYNSVSNELLDERNLYLDKLSQYLNITVESNKDGSVSIKSGDEYLLNAQTAYKAELSIDSSSDDVKLMNEASEFSVEEGQIKGYMQSLNGLGNYASGDEDTYTGIRYYQKALDDFAASFSSTFNTLNGDLIGEDKPLFEGSTAKDISISTEWSNNANYITASNNTDAEEGDNDNITRMINAMDSDQTISSIYTGTFEAYMTSLMSNVGIDVNYMTSLQKSSKLILTSIDTQRKSVSGVSLDEEAVNVIKYQKAFQAASRLMTAYDEILDTLIKSMGIVGR